MTDGRVYVGDVGVKFIVHTGIDLKDAITTQLQVKKSDGTPATWNTTAATVDTMDMEYISETGDLDVVGTYTAYAYVEFSGDSKHSGQAFKFKVWDVFK
jgi:hypothetical protein